MTNTNIKNNIPVYGEEQIINQQRGQIEEILGKFHQLVPTSFIQLETKERNYMCSTEGWKEPACERYIFFYHDKSVQLDIPQKLISELELKKGQDILYPFYISPDILSKELSFGAITIEDKKEIFIQKPLTTNNLEGELTSWLTELKSSREQISQLITTEQSNQDLTQENQLLKIELQGEKQLGQAQRATNQVKINALKRKKEELENSIDEKDNEIDRLTTQINDLENEKQQIEDNLENWTGQFSNQTFQQVQEKINALTAERDSRPTWEQLANLQTELNRVKTKLEEEDGWWNRWFCDNEKTIVITEEGDEDAVYFLRNIFNDKKLPITSPTHVSLVRPVILVRSYSPSYLLGATKNTFEIEVTTNFTNHSEERALHYFFNVLKRYYSKK